MRGSTPSTLSATVNARGQRRKAVAGGFSSHLRRSLTNDRPSYHPTPGRRSLDEHWPPPRNTLSNHANADTTAEIEIEHNDAMEVTNHTRTKRHERPIARPPSTTEHSERQHTKKITLTLTLSRRRESHPRYKLRERWITGR